MRLTKLALSGALLSAVLPIAGFPVQTAAPTQTITPGAVAKPGPVGKPAPVTTDALVGGMAAAWFKSEWQSYAQRFITTDGRIVDNANGGVSHSEGQGYGLLFASMARDADRFQAMWTWTRSHLMVRTDGLAAWKWDPKAGAVTDMNNATDGDILIAWALWNAANRFGRADYREAAQVIARAVGSELVVGAKQGAILLPGALGFGAADRRDGPVINLSYWVFPAFAALKELAPETDWEGVRRTGMAILDHSRFGPYGLPSEWESLGGPTPQPAQGFPTEFGYNAIRIPLYLALEGSETSRKALHRFAGRWTQTGSPTHLVDLKAAAISPPIGAPGYDLIFALARCATAGEVIPPEMINARSDLYYPETLRLLSVVAIQERFPSCL